MAYSLTHDHLGQNYYANSMAGGPAGFCIHHSAGTQPNVKSTFLANSTSANYSIKDGDVVCYVEDANGTWHCGDSWGNRNLISIECVNSGGSAAGWPVSETTVSTLVEFLADKCVEHGISRLVVGENLYKHSDFYATSCPYQLSGRMEEIASRVNAILEGDELSMATLEEVQEAVWGKEYNGHRMDERLYLCNYKDYDTWDPTGRTSALDDHAHIKWIAARQAWQTNLLVSIAEKLGVEIPEWEFDEIKGEEPAE